MPSLSPGPTHDGPAPVRVAIVNDYHLVVHGLAALLAPFAERVAVVELDSNAPVTGDVDIVLYDTFSQPQGKALDREVLQSLGDQTRLVVFTWNAEPTIVEQTREVGAHAVVSKRASAEELVATIERVHSGELVLPAHATNDGPVRSGRWPGQDHGLSAREAEVLALICQGLGNQEIAERTYLGINTIKSYIRSAYRKIDVSTRAQAVIWGLSHGFEPDQLSSSPSPH